MDPTKNIGDSFLEIMIFIFYVKLPGGTHNFEVLASPALAADPTRMSERLQTWKKFDPVQHVNKGCHHVQPCPCSTHIYFIDFR